MTSRFKRADALLWMLRILLAFVYEGVHKVSERRLWLRVFQDIGLGQWF